MKIQLFVEYTGRTLSIWTPNLKSEKLERPELRHRLYYDLYSDKNSYTHCGNKKRVSKIFPNVEY